MPKENARMFGPQHWNAIAKDIRTEAQYFLTVTSDPDFRSFTVVTLRTVSNLAIRFAVRFKIDNPDFDVLKWLDQCSPDPDMYPFSELWREDES